MKTKTEFEWKYEPDDFFEAPLVFQLVNGKLSVEAGKAVYTLTNAIDPVKSAFRESIIGEVERVFKLHQISTHEAYAIGRLKIIQHKDDGRRNTEILTGFDAILKVKAGGSEAEKEKRIESHTAFIDALLPKLGQSATLRKMVESYSRAVQDPDDELVHLFEICEAAKQYFGNESAARSALGISKKKWGLLAIPANDENIRQGRHRGKREEELRDATSEELAKARYMAKHIITEFAEKVNLSY